MVRDYRHFVSIVDYTHARGGSRPLTEGSQSATTDNRVPGTFETKRRHYVNVNANIIYNARIVNSVSNQRRGREQVEVATKKQG